MKRLLLVRHAKTEFIHQDITDFERNLLEQGIQDAKKVSELVLNKGFKPELILASSANRTQQTARIFAHTYGYNINNIVVKSELYDNYTTQEFINMLGNEGGDRTTVMVVGHNPEMEYLAYNLASDFFEIVEPCTVVALEFDVDSWDKIEVEKGELVLYEYPKRQ